ncbi:MAG: MFS transporter [bacterium]
MNKVIKTLILTDLILIIGINSYSPIFAIFVAETIQGGDVKVAGLASSIYWIVSSLMTVPIGHFLDKKRKEKVNLLFIIFGNLIAGAALFFYNFSKLPWHIYLIEGISGLGMAMNIPAYSALFTRHIDEGKEASEWSLRSALTGVGVGLAGAAGGFLAEKFGFSFLFSAVSVFVVLGAMLPIFVFRQIGRAGAGSALSKETKITNPSLPK